MYAQPDKQAEKIGYLRIGARVARSSEAVAEGDCPGGWYAVRPLGFVCAGQDATIRHEEPLARAIVVEPRRSSPLPYAYARTRGVVQNYMRVPTTAEQLEHGDPPALDPRHRQGLSAELDQTSAEPSPMPLAKTRLASGPMPEPVPATDPSAPFDSDGSDAVPWWLVGERGIPNLAPFDVPLGAVVAGSSQRQAGVALIDAFAAGEAASGRRFAITTDARLLPVDRLDVAVGSPFHGEDLRELGLPVAFGWSNGARFWTLDTDRLLPGRRLARREFVPLTGKVRVMGGARMVEARDGSWLRSAELRIAAKPSELPSFARRERRWIDVSVTHQVLVLWEGERPVYATLVSTGPLVLGDSDTTASAPLGTFRVRQKHVTTTLDADVADKDLELRDVPWVMYVEGGHALHGTYWHDDFGRERAGGAVTLAPIDARFVFEWSLPDVPEHWHGAYASGSFGEGTLIRIGR